MSFSSNLGRWLQEDPIDFHGGDPNFYRYLGNNPANGTDPLGLAKGPPNQPGTNPTKEERKSYCEALLKMVHEVGKELMDRARDLINDPHNLRHHHREKCKAHPRFGSVDGHKEHWQGLQKKLDHLLELWNHFCNNHLREMDMNSVPDLAWTLRRMPVPDFNPITIRPIVPPVLVPGTVPAPAPTPATDPLPNPWWRPLLQPSFPILPVFPITPDWDPFMRDPRTPAQA